jgi:hypothetical protein
VWHCLTNSVYRFFCPPCPSSTIYTPQSIRTRATNWPPFSFLRLVPEQVLDHPPDLPDPPLHKVQGKIVIRVDPRRRILEHHREPLDVAEEHPDLVPNLINGRAARVLNIRQLLPHKFFKPLPLPPRQFIFRKSDNIGHKHPVSIKKAGHPSAPPSSANYLPSLYCDQSGRLLYATPPGELPQMPFFSLVYAILN